MKKIAVALAVLLTAGCANKKPVEPREPYIKSYLIIEDELDVYLAWDAAAGILNFCTVATQTIGNESVDDDLELYLKLCENSDDLTFEGTPAADDDYGIAPVKPTRPNGVADKSFFSIKVISNIDAPEHPAGTSLNDLVRIVALTLNPYIKSNYTALYDWLLHPAPVGLTLPATGRTTAHLLDKPLSEVTREDLRILLCRDGVLFRLYFNAGYPIDQPQTIVVRFNMAQFDNDNGWSYTTYFIRS